ncbi:hypothetical protein [Kiloniella majae]|uniref:hypothetical protein n=1 Tax=Kiloniella majae TaxID=1938558 RepID=UPI000A278E72|nr:hypothetical protein [Kiloniella majae]
MTEYLCATCGTQYPEQKPDPASPPSHCPICEDERQYVPDTGQKWITSSDLKAQHHIRRERHSEKLHSLVIDPRAAIGQRAFLIETPYGNVLWDCLSILDQTTIDWIKSRGKLAAIAISHPHYYTAMGDWSDAFDQIHIYLHQDDAQWVQKPHPAIHHWTENTLSINPDITLIKCGGHFEGGTVLHWRKTKGYLFTGDIMQVVADQKYVSFMYSYPNYIPLSHRKVENIGHSVESYDFDVVHGAFEGRSINKDGKQAVRRSVNRYLKALEA